MATSDLAISGTVLVEGRLRPGGVEVADGRVVAVHPAGTRLDARDRVTLAYDEVLLPGLVDSHVHVNEPGRTEWEGFASATRAAAAGGVTTIVDMPLNSIPPTVDLAALDVKRGRPGAGSTWTWASGAAPSRGRSAASPPCTRPGCAASSASWPTAGCRSSPR